MTTTLFTRYKRYLKKIRSGRILDRIGAGKVVFFENPMKKIAIRYSPGETGKLSKYYVKPYGRNEYEIDYNSRFILRVVMEGKPMSEARYNNYYSFKDAPWNLELFETCSNKAAVVA